MPVVAAKPLLAVSVMPLFALSVMLAVACSAPPFRVISFARTDPGTAPKLPSELIDKIPPEIVVMPV